MTQKIRTFTIVGTGLLAALLLAGCGAEAGDVGQPAGDQAATPPAPAARPASAETSGKGTVLESLTVAGHVIQFVEAAPGTGAIIESIPHGEDRLVPDIGDASLVDIHKSLTADAVPEALLQADERRIAQMAAPAPAVAAPPVEAPAVGTGKEFFTTSEQTWFRNTYCNGANSCAQGWDWAFSGTINHANENFVAWDGSEGTTNASLTIDYWKPQPTFLGIPEACGSGVDCGWIQFYSAIVVPGHGVSVNVWGASQYQGHLGGGGGNTQVSLAARPN